MCTILLYKDTSYYYGMVANQFSIAEAAFNGHEFSYEPVLSIAVRNDANSTGSYIPLEKWKDYPRSGQYKTFPAKDLPGYGYLISFTSKLFGGELTSRYAFAIQILLELVALLLFCYCVYLAFGERIAFISGMLYIIGYPFIWPIASQPMRDIFVLGVYSFYVTAFFLFRQKNNILSYLIIVALVSMASMLLWVRPSGYYFFFLIAPTILLVRDKGLLSRMGFLSLTILLPLLIFGIQHKQFNLKHYGVKNTHFLGASMWEGMGNIKDNPYGFVYNDAALVPFVKEHYGLDLEYLTPEMNRLLFEYSLEVIKEDPAYYLKTVLRRCKNISTRPVSIVYPKGLEPKETIDLSETNLSVFGYAKKHPQAFILKVFSRIFAFSFFYGGVILTLLLFMREKPKRLDILILISPLIYTLATQIPVRFEGRYLATGAWVLIAPLAFYIEVLIQRIKSRKERSAKVE